MERKFIRFPENLAAWLVSGAKLKSGDKDRLLTRAAQ
jgi:hypothetical protein